MLIIDHVQGDPFASPSHLSVRVSGRQAGFPNFCFASSDTRIALQDLILRKFEEQIRSYSFRAKGSGKSCLITSTVCGQEILERTACEITAKEVILRFCVGKFEEQIRSYSFRAKGSGKSGLITSTVCGQEILERTACEITAKEVILRFCVGFPANGRTINAQELEKILFDFLPVCVKKALYYKNLNPMSV